MNWNRSVIHWVVLALVVLSLSAASFAQIAVGVSVRIGPPALPVYAQPICPGPGYIWTPGYWAWGDDDGYYWVPGTWVLAPVGMLWTPGWWGWGGGFYAWHAGYWGPHIGFYGGINYGFGYTGVGFVGGEWRGGAFYYNRAVTNVSVTNVTHVYNKTVVVNNTTVNNVSFNGGTGGVHAEATPQERAAEHEQHVAPLATQTQHQTLASQNRQNFASVNQGRPAVAATAKAGDFSAHSAIAARSAGGEYQAPKMSPREARGPAAPGNRPFSPSNTNSANRNPGTSTPTPQDKGFRPFTPPSNNPKNTTGSSSGGNQGKSSQGFKSFTPPSNNKSGTGSGGGNQGKSNDGFKSFTPPSNNHKTSQPTTTHNSRPATQHNSQPHTQSAPAHHNPPPARQNHPSSPPKNEHH